MAPALHRDPRSEWPLRRMLWDALETFSASSCTSLQIMTIYLACCSFSVSEFTVVFINKCIYIYILPISCPFITDFSSFLNSQLQKEWQDSLCKPFLWLHLNLQQNHKGRSCRPPSSSPSADPFHRRFSLYSV